KSPAELVGHFYRVLELCRDYKKPVAQQLFWMRPIIGRGQEGISFGWVDTFAECMNWVSAVCSGKNGELWSDVDQGWEVCAFGDGGSILVAQGPGPGEKDEVIAAYRFRRSSFEEKNRVAGERIATLIPRINSELGMEIFK